MTFRTYLGGKVTLKTFCKITLSAFVKNGWAGVTITTLQRKLVLKLRTLLNNAVVKQGNMCEFCQAALIATLFIFFLLTLLWWAYWLNCALLCVLGSGTGVLSRPMQRKLVTLINCQLMEGEGRSRAMRAARSLGERTVTELILQHQNPQQLSANLWAAVRARGCQFLGPGMIRCMDSWDYALLISSLMISYAKVTKTYFTMSH